MKCKCGLEMELWQNTLIEGKLVKRYRCVCGNEESAEIIGREKPKEDTKPPIKGKE
jgi:hypothetical protein